MSVGYDIWGVVAGALGTLSLLPILCAIVKNQLPSTKFKVLHDAMSETESLFRTVLEEGLLQDQSYVSETEGLMRELRSEIEDLRAATHRATSLMKEIGEVFKGLSRQISMRYEEVKALRANISETSSKERRRLLNLTTCGVAQPSSATARVINSLDIVPVHNHLEEFIVHGCESQNQANLTVTYQVPSSSQLPHLNRTQMSGSLQSSTDLAEIEMRVLAETSMLSKSTASSISLRYLSDSRSDRGGPSIPHSPTHQVLTIPSLGYSRRLDNAPSSSPHLGLSGTPLHPDIRMILSSCPPRRSQMCQSIVSLRRVLRRTPRTMSASHRRRAQLTKIVRAHRLTARRTQSESPCEIRHVQVNARDGVNKVILCHHFTVPASSTIAMVDDEWEDVMSTMG